VRDRARAKPTRARGERRLEEALPRIWWTRNWLTAAYICEFEASQERSCYTSTWPDLTRFAELRGSVASVSTHIGVFRGR